MVAYVYVTKNSWELVKDKIEEVGNITRLYVFSHWDEDRYKAKALHENAVFVRVLDTVPWQAVNKLKEVAPFGYPEIVFTDDRFFASGVKYYYPMSKIIFVDG